MNILVTSGGTIENIDAVRSISNISSGKLGSLIAEKFIEESSVEKVFYICGRNSMQPQNDKLEILYVSSVLSLEDAVKQVFAKARIDIIIHCMAVSDYRVKAVTSAANLADLLLSNYTLFEKLGKQNAKSAIAALIDKSESLIQGDGKISSNVDDMIILMERTSKIINQFQTLSPKSTLVGFKLLDNVTLEALIDKGFQILTDNKCSFVLANNLKDINADQHIGYLIDRDKNYTRHETKAEIAAALVAATLKERGS